MTNKFKHIAMMLFVAGAMVMATSCSKDEDSSGNTSSIKGWYFTNTEYYSDIAPGIGFRDFIHIVTDSYLERGGIVDHVYYDYNTPLEGHSGWYRYSGSSLINHSFVRDGDLIVCDNGDMISIDGNKLRFDGRTYNKE